MRKRTATLPASSNESLNEPPHVLSELIEMGTGQLHLSLTQQKQIGAHLVVCPHCQICLVILLTAIERNEEQSSLKSPVQTWLVQLAYYMHETLKESLPAYVDYLREKGIEAANKRFTLLIHHLQVCRECRLAVHALRAWLDQLEHEADL